MPLNMRPTHGGDGGGGFGGMPWLLCDLQPVGKRLVRGSRDVPDAFWTFCPLKKFPRDKIKIKECKDCKHFKGFRRSFTNKIVQSLEELGPLTQLTFPKRGIQGNNIQRGGSIQNIRQDNQDRDNQSSKPMNIKIIKKKPLPKKHELTDGEIEQSLKEELEKRRKWEEEEKKIMGNNNEN